jgi:Rieske Fe-S protein
MRTNPSFNKDEYSYLPSEKGSRTKGSRKGKQHTVASGICTHMKETFIEGAWNRLSV